MPGRLPNEADFAFSKPIAFSITPPSSSQQPINVLILLHGLGDTHVPFTNLGRQMNLPETVCISIRAPKPLPFDLGGFHWGDDLYFEPSSDAMNKDTGFRASAKLIIEEVVQRALIEGCGYEYRDILFFGYSQGGMAALQVGAELQDEELGGIVCIAGWLPDSAPMLPIDKKSRTPVLLCKAAISSEVPASALARLKDTYQYSEVKEWKRNADGMPRNREEMLPIMQFLARRLRSRKGVLEGAIELL
ncbi:alpha/beta-hydrolase [Pseudovirgaria hyperparasitica]|uniref:Alpha/beta-hydrolase n=1 Tax=Pseudovirgaria hyperparasitica TaxID=470096 RepID=A0A6A6VXT0_9PEZI|nr:alpha/beta-hydrolase [Pseudovirgaria hyperparasitica]KAF2754061.1 alpha/beta-hydrolase [Pseudovirgaria hyperparasitica]